MAILAYYIANKIKSDIYIFTSASLKDVMLELVKIMGDLCKKPKLNKRLKKAVNCANKETPEDLIEALEELYAWAFEYNKLDSDNKFEFTVEYVES